MILENLKAIPATDPSDLLRLRDSVYATDLLITAIGKFDFFSWLKVNPSDFNCIINHFEIKARPADVMLTYFKALGLIEQEKEIFRITLQTKEFLTDQSQWSLVPYFSTQTERPIVDKMYDVLKTGMPASWGAKKEELDWGKAMERDEFADMFKNDIPAGFDIHLYSHAFHDWDI